MELSSEMFTLDPTSTDSSKELEKNSSNSMVMDLLSSIQLDCFDDVANFDSFNFANDTSGRESPFQQMFNDTTAVLKDPYGISATRALSSESPLSHMYSPLSEPGTPVMSMSQLTDIQGISPSFSDAGYDSDPQMNMFASPQMSEYQMASPPMTPMMSMAGSPLMQSYTLPSEVAATSSAGGLLASVSPDMGSDDLGTSVPEMQLPPTTIGLNSKKEQVYKCGCGKSFKKLHSLEIHSKLHQRDRAYACNVCFKRFLRPHDLKRHKLTHIEGYKPFECSNCGVTFTRQDAMHRHINARRCMN